MGADLGERVSQVHVRLIISCESRTLVQEKEIRLIQNTPQSTGDLGKVDPGRFAVEAVGYEIIDDQICAIARGCKPQTFSAGGEGTILIELDALPEPPSCMPLGDGGIGDGGTEEDAFVEPPEDSGVCRATNEICNGEDDDCDSRIDEAVGGIDNRNSCGLCRVVCEQEETCLRGACVPPIIGVAPGAEHTCAVRGNGEAYCWGQNVVGQLGLGTTAESLSPARVTGLSDATQIGVGRFHSCALRETGQVVCWGDTTWGQVGAAGGFRNAPTLIGGTGTTVRGIGVGFFHNCLVNEAGNVACWGWAGRGQLGRPYTHDLEVQATVAQVAGVQNAVEVESGFSFSCARHQDRTVSCWGFNDYGQLGDGSRVSRYTPALIEDASGNPLNDVIALGTGGEHACVLREGGTEGEGTVLCWGANDYGSVGNGTTGGPVVNPTATNITNAVEIAVGYLTSCARRPNDKMFCWGVNEMGQLGNGNQLAQSSPVEVLSLTTSGLFEDSGDYHTCAIGEDMSVYCWGNNTYGQLGLGNKGPTPHLTPTRVPSL